MADTLTAAGGNRAARRAATAEAKGEKKRETNARGFAKLVVGDTTYKIQLLLSTLADLEDAFEVDNLQELQFRLERGGSRDFGKMLAILVNSGEGKEIVTADDCRRWPITLPQAFAALFSVLRSAGAQTDEEADAEGK